MTKKILLGLFCGLFANAIGVVVCTFIISKVKDLSFVNTFKFYQFSDGLWMLLALGALPNLALFFWLLKKDKEYMARGVVMATFITAITTYILYFN